MKSFPHKHVMQENANIFYQGSDLHEIAWIKTQTSDLCKINKHTHPHKLKKKKWKKNDETHNYIQICGTQHVGRMDYTV